MKNIYSLAIAAFLYLTAASAQQSYGLYKSLNDFKQHKISIPANPKLGDKAIQISDFFLRPSLYIKTDNGQNKNSMDSVFTIRCAHGSAYRIWNRKAYLLVDTGFIKIYGYSCQETVKKPYSRGYRLDTEQVTRYFFSKNCHSPISNLSLTNMKLAMHLDEKKDSMLVQSFPDDDTLLSHNNHHFLVYDFLNNLK